MESPPHLWQFTSVDGLASCPSSVLKSGHLDSKNSTASELFALAETHLLEEDAEKALKAATDALLLFREAGVTDSIVDALRLVITCHRCDAESKSKEPIEAWQMAQKEFQRFEDEGKKHGVAAMLLSLAQCEFVMNKGKGSQDLVKKVLNSQAMFHEVGDKKMEAIAFLVIIDMRLAIKGDEREQRRQARESLRNASSAIALFKAIDCKMGVAKAYHSDSAARVALGTFKGGIWAQEQAVKLYRDLGMRKLEAVECCCLAQNCLKIEKTRALWWAEKSLQLFQKLEARSKWESFCTCLILQCQAETGKRGDALARANENLKRFRDEADKSSEVQMLGLIMTLNADLEDSKEVLVPQDMLKERTIQEARARKHGRLAKRHMSNSDYELAKKELLGEIAIWEELGCQEDFASALNELARVYLQEGDGQLCAKTAKQAAFVAREAANKAHLATSLSLLSVVESMYGNVNKSIDLCFEALEELQDTSHWTGQINCYNQLNQLYMAQKRYVDALWAARQALALGESLGDSLLHVKLLITVAKTQAMLSTELDDSEDELFEENLWGAMSSARKALALARRAGENFWISLSLFTLGEISLVEGDYEEALTLANEAAMLSKNCGDPVHEAQSIGLCAHAHYKIGNLQEASDMARKGQAMSQEVQDLEGEDAVRVILEEIEQVLRRGDVGTIPLVPESIVKIADPAEPGPVVKSKETAKDRELLMKTVLSVARDAVGDDSEIDLDSPLMEAGMDSLSMVSFRNNLLTELDGVDLPATVVFEYPTLHSLVDFLME